MNVESNGINVDVCVYLLVRTLMVDQPALRRPETPSVVKAERMTAPQKGATSSDQSAVFMSCHQQIATLNPSGREVACKARLRRAGL